MTAERSTTLRHDSCVLQQKPDPRFAFVRCYAREDMSDWISRSVQEGGYWGIALAMLLENIFPPIPSEVIMPAAGYQSRRGELSFLAVVLAGTCGSLIGAVGWYWAAVAIGRDRLLHWLGAHGVWIGVTRRDAQKALRWFARHDTTAVLVGRMIPGIRTLISIPAGFDRMPMPRFLVWTTIGTFGWNLGLAAIGWWLRDQFRAVTPYVSGVGTAVIGAIVAWWLFRIAKHRGWLGNRSHRANE